MAIATRLLDRLDDEVQSADYRTATDTFCRLIAQEGRPIGDAIHAAIAAAAPFVQVPSHLMRTSSGDIRGVNYDHTVLGWRGAIYLRNYLPPARALLPTVQAMWYVPQGLSIWEQILCEFPGHYARAEGCEVRYPSDDGEERFDGLAWTPPKIHFDEHEPILNGSVDERMERLTWAIAMGQRDESYSLYMGLAQDPRNHDRLKECALFAGIIDLQDTLINRGGYQNIGHKALRARAMVDIGDFLGWERSREIIYTVVPDLGCEPQLFGLWTEISNLCKIELPNYAQIPKRATPLAERELDDLTFATLWGGPHEINEILLGLYHRGHGILDIADGIAVAYQRYMIDLLVHPSAFLRPMHAFDYQNVVNSWIRKYDNPHMAKAVFLTARFTNDTVRANNLFPRDPKVELAPTREYRGWADSLPLDRLLPALHDAILAQEPPPAMALIDSYLARTSDRRKLIEAITYASSHFQNDPHIMRNCASSIEEWTHNQTSRRDDILRGWVKCQTRYIKRTLTRECVDLYERHFIS